MSSVIFSGKYVKALKEGLNLFNHSTIWSNNFDPSVTGFAAPEGDVFISTLTATLYVKKGPGDTDWSGVPGTWLGPVANFAALPVTGNKDGDTRITLDVKHIYMWDQPTTTWVRSEDDKANRDLGNLTPTAINQSLIFADGVGGQLSTRDEASGITQDLLVKTGDATAGNSGSVFVLTGAGNTSGDIVFRTAGTTVDSNSSGNVIINSGTSDGLGGATGAILLSTGDATQDGESGSLTIRTGNTDTTPSGSLGISTGDSNNSDIGSLNIKTGNASNSGNVNPILIQGGSSVDGDAGSITIAAGLSTGAGGPGQISVTAQRYTSTTIATTTIGTANASGTDSSGNITIQTGSADAGGSGSIVVRTRSAVASSAGSINIVSGASNSAGDGGDINITGGNAVDPGHTGGPITLKSGNGDTAGDIALNVGTGASVPGNLRFTGVNEGTAGDVWQSIDVSGNGTWTTPIWIPLADEGVPNGVATLDSSGKVPVSQLPSVVMEYQGAWNPNTNSPVLSDGTGTNGFVYYVTVLRATAVSGLTDPSMVNFQIGDLVIYSGSVNKWQLVTPAAGVMSVNGAQGAVTVNAINQLTGDVTAGPASGSQSAVATIVSGSIVPAKLGTITDGVTLDQSGAGSTLEVKTGGISPTQLASAAVTPVKLATVTDGITLDQSGTGSTLEIKTGGVADAQVSATAAIARTKLAAGTINSFATNGSGGALQSTAVTASRAVATDTNGLPVASATTAAELAFVSGATSNIQAQINTLVAGTPGDLPLTAFTASQSVASPANVTGLAFANASVRAFKAIVSVSVVATSSLFEVFEIQGIQRGADWVISSYSTGDTSAFLFTITTAGQIQYTSGTYAGFVSATVKFRAQVTTV